jgi:alkaline phosphatase D
MADEDIDFWVHYGDYVYVHDFATLTPADYRQVYQRFKANPLLQELHAPLSGGGHVGRR